jgi:branched-chain amino acid transport system substrate-binding protein
MSLMVMMVLILFPSLGTAAEPLTVAIVCELTGPGAPVGARWQKGVQMAAEEINASGGVLGRQIETFTLDTGTDPAASVAAMKKAIERKPFVVLGTVYSSSTIVNMSILQQAGIPQITGSGAAPITQKGNMNIFRTQMNGELAMQKMVKWITEILKVQKMAIVYANDVMGKGARDPLLQLLPPKGVQIVADVSTEVGQTDFTGEVARVKTSGADTIFIYLHEEECGRMLPQIKEMGLTKTMRIIGPETLATEDTIRLAREAANGIQSHVELSPVADMWKPVAEKYAKKYNETADHNFFKGYLGTQIFNAVMRDIKVFDQQKFRGYLHNRTLCVKDHAGIRNSIHYDEKGDIDWSTLIVTVKDQKQVIQSMVPPLHPEHFEKCKK